MSIHDLVYERRYDELREYLVKCKNEKKLSRLELYALQLVNIYRNTRNGKKIRFTSEYDCNESDYFRRVFLALRQYDMVNAKKYLELTIDRANDPQEFQTYLYLVDDILELDKANTDIRNLNIEIKDVVDGIEDLDIKSYYKLNNLFNSRLDIENSVGYDNWYSKVCKDILDTTMLVKEKNLTKPYFGNTGTGETLEDEVVSSLSTGDYPNAYRILHRIDYRTELPNLNYYYLLCIKKLLTLFNKSLFQREQMGNVLLDNVITYLYFEVCDKDMNTLRELLKNKEEVEKIINNMVSEEVNTLKKV